MLLAAQNINRETFLSAPGCCLVDRTQSHTLYKESGSIWWAVVACWELWLSASEAQTFTWGMFSILFCVSSRLRPTSNTAAPQRRLKRNTSYCRRSTKLIHPPFAKEQNSQQFEFSVSKIAAYLTVPKQQQNIKSHGDPGIGEPIGIRNSARIRLRASYGNYLSQLRRNPCVVFP